MAKKMFRFADPGPTGVFGGPRTSKFDPWVKAAIDSPNQWIVWDEPKHTSFSTTMKKFVKINYPDYKFDFTSRATNRKDRRYCYIICLGSPAPEPGPYAMVAEARRFA